MNSKDGVIDRIARREVFEVIRNGFKEKGSKCFVKQSGSSQTDSTKCIMNPDGSDGRKRGFADDSVCLNVAARRGEIRGKAHGTEKGDRLYPVGLPICVDEPLSWPWSGKMKVILISGAKRRKEQMQGSAHLVPDHVFLANWVNPCAVISGMTLKYPSVPNCSWRG